MGEKITQADKPVVLITGASKRIGKALAESLHNSGYRCIIHCNTNKTLAEALADKLNEVKPDTAIVLQADLSDPKQTEALAKDAQRVWGRIDLLINNASVFAPDNDNPEFWDDTYNTNVKANYLLCRALRKSLAENQGSILNLIDIYANRPLSNHSIYSSSKAACNMLTKSLAVEFAPSIRVNGISPGAILWPEETPSDADKSVLLSKIPLKRLGSTQAIVETALYLVRCDYITGQIIPVDGGRSITI